MGTQVDDKETQYAQVEVRLLLRDVSKGMRSFSGSLRGRFRMIRLVVRSCFVHRILLSASANFCHQVPFKNSVNVI